ncbi:amidase [Microbacteriaceae bacterium K1510]|nr:amidase [Microbacteriaceae bacterium K1510]
MSGPVLAPGMPGPYRPATTPYPSFAQARRAFQDGTDTPRAFLERGLERLAAAEPKVQAFVCLDLSAARAAADASTARWHDGRPLSLVDGLPLAVKDCFDVQGFPTRVNSALFADAPPAHFDAAHVEALRRSGAVAVGKTVTTELTMAAPGPTMNPWDLRRTPGGSSSGSAAAVAAGMVPLATGSQVRGSGIRPASICGVTALKPTFGALNRHGGFDPSPSLNHLVLLGGHLDDIWQAAHVIAQDVGGDPGFQPLAGGPDLPEPRKPLRLARQCTFGWTLTDEASKEAFEVMLRRLATLGVEIDAPEAGEELAAYEDATVRTPEWFFDLMLWEIRSLMRAHRDRHPEAMSETMRGHVAKAEALTVEDYRRSLAARQDLRTKHRALRGKVDAFIALAHIGPGQFGQPLLGTPWYNDPSSAIGAPALNLPLLAVDHAPLGIQLMGFEGEDRDLIAMAHWIMEAFARRQE